VTVASGTTFELGNLQANQPSATLIGTGSLTGSGKFLWTAGDDSGNLTVASTIATTISGSERKSVSAPASQPATLTLQGSTTLNAQLDTSGAKITNTGTFTMQTGAIVQADTCCVSPDQFVNTGSVVMPAAGTATLAWLDFKDQGSVSIASGSTLFVTVGPTELSAGVDFSGGGTIAFGQKDTVTLAKNVTVASGTTFKLGNLLANQSSAKLIGTGSLTGSGKFLWTAGADSGNLTVASTIATTISGSDAKSVSAPATQDAVLNLHGPTTLAAQLGTSGAKITNTGAFTMQTGAIVQAGTCCVTPDQFINTGSLVVAAGTGSAAMSNLRFTTAGTVKITSGTFSLDTLPYVQTAGSTSLASGNLSSSKPVTISGGSLVGHGTVTGSIVNQAAVHPSTTGGVLTVTGTYTQTSSGTLVTTLSGTTAGNGFGQLVVNGAATLAGTISSTTATGFAPTPGQTFAILRYGSHAGEFSAHAGNRLGYTVVYGSAAATLLYGVPWITRVTPNAGPAAGHNSVVVTGGGFTAGTTVRFGTTAAASTFVSATQLNVTVPSHAGGVVQVTATNGVGPSAPGPGDLYAFGLPSITSFTPTSGITGSSVTITGTNLVPGATVKFGAIASPSVTFVSPTHVKAVVPNGAVAAAIAITTPAGTGASTSTFTPTLSITGFTPASGPPGTAVTIAGIGFNNTSSVAFNGTPAASVTFVSASQLTATVPGSATTGPITVTNTAAPTGTVASRSSYTP
jgi:hypothetical protein